MRIEIKHGNNTYKLTIDDKSDTWVLIEDKEDENSILFPRDRIEKLVEALIRIDNEVE